MIGVPRVAVIFAEDIGERMPTVIPVRVSWSDSSGGEVEVSN
jgi:hypothetical protein